MGRLKSQSPERRALWKVDFFADFLDGDLEGSFIFRLIHLHEVSHIYHLLYPFGMNKMK